MHWHGLTQFGSPFRDGTPAASQWPVPPGKYFDYEFMLDEDISGTLYVPVLMSADKKLVSFACGGWTFDCPRSAYRSSARWFSGRFKLSDRI